MCCSIVFFIAKSLFIVGTASCISKQHSSRPNHYLDSTIPEESNAVLRYPHGVYISTPSFYSSMPGDVTMSVLNFHASTQQLASFIDCDCYDMELQPSLNPSSHPSTNLISMISSSPTTLLSTPQRNDDIADPPTIFDTDHFPTLSPAIFNPIHSIPSSNPVARTFAPTAAVTPSFTNNSPTISPYSVPATLLIFDCEFLITNLTDHFMNETDLPIIILTTANVLNLSLSELNVLSWKPLRRLSTRYDEGPIHGRLMYDTVIVNNQITTNLKVADDFHRKYELLSKRLKESVITTGFYTWVLRRNAFLYKSAALDFATTIEVRIGPPRHKDSDEQYRSTHDIIPLIISICILIFIFITFLATCVEWKDKVLQHSEDHNLDISVSSRIESI